MQVSDNKQKQKMREQCDNVQTVLLSSKIRGSGACFYQNSIPGS